MAYLLSFIHLIPSTTWNIALIPTPTPIYSQLIHLPWIYFHPPVILKMLCWHGEKTWSTPLNYPLYPHWSYLSRNGGVLLRWMGTMKKGVLVCGVPRPSHRQCRTRNRKWCGTQQRILSRMHLIDNYPALIIWSQSIGYAANSSSILITLLHATHKSKCHDQPTNPCGA